MNRIKYGTCYVCIINFNFNKMKKVQLNVMAVLLSSTVLFSSCLGSFKLFNSVSSWNQQVTGSKFVNELIFIGLNIIPVYGVASIADVLIFNSIEFWSGKNPVADTSAQVFDTENGKVTVQQTEDGYAITSETGEAMNLCFNEATQTWSMEANGETHKILAINNDGTADLYLQDGTTTNVELNAQGMMAARAATQQIYFAFNK